MMTRSAAPAPMFSSPMCAIGTATANRGWTQQENKLFENALAMVDIQTSNGWARVAEITGRTVSDVIMRYRVLEIDVGKIEAGDYPFVGYRPSSLSFGCDGTGGAGIGPVYCAGAKRGPGGRMAEQERKKGVPWTEDEHRLFLLGLKKYGKGDWRNISRNYVITRTPTQVASHAQKYFIRLNSGGKDKRRASIHDITTSNLPENSPSSPSQSSGLTTQSNSTKTDEPNYDGDMLMKLPNYSPYAVKFESQNQFKDGIHNAMFN